MRQLAQRLFAPVIHHAFGDPGAAALQEVLEYVRLAYQHLDPENIKGVLYVFRRLPVEPASDATGTTRARAGRAGAGAPRAPAAKRAADVAPAGPGRAVTRVDRLPKSLVGVVVVEVLENGQARIWRDADVDERALSRVAVLYRFERGRESFVVQGRHEVIENLLAPCTASVFAQPTFSELRDALEDYRDRLVRASSCPLFQQAWEDASRMFFTGGPEEHMRRSLDRHLHSVLRDAEVRPEQNVDESHPVDIKVTWGLAGRRALIEIKWLGKSRVEGRVTAEHYDKRARDGAKQLAEYLDANRQEAPTLVTRGYLVVIDGRRHGLTAESRALGREDGLRYADAEVEYNPRYHDERDDFEEPIRMFAEPSWERAREVVRRGR